MVTMASPATRPAGRGRRPGDDLADPDADLRLAPQRDAREDHEREQEVHHDAGEQDAELDRQPRAREGARVVGVVAVLALELDEAADRQPVERVQRARRLVSSSRPSRGTRRPRACRARSRAAARARPPGGRGPGGSGLPRPRTLARGGKPMPNSSTRTFAQRAVTKWPSSWIRTSAPRIRMNSRTVTIDWAKPIMRAARRRDRSRMPRGPRASSAISVVDVGRLVRAAAEPRHGGLEQARDAREVERAVEEPGHGDLVGRDQRGRGAAADAAGVARDAERREARLVRGAEVQLRRGHEVGRGRR